MQNRSGFNILNLLLEEYNNSNDFLTSLENATKKLEVPIFT